MFSIYKSQNGHTSFPCFAIYSLSARYSRLAMALVFFLLGFALFPSISWASSSQGHGFSFQALLWPAVNFSIYALLISYYYKTRGITALKRRSVEIEARVEKAGLSLREARSERDQLKIRLMEIETEKAAIARHYEEEGRRMRESILSGANAKADTIADDTVRQIEREMSAARKELRREAIAEATRVARQLIANELTAEVDCHLRKAVLEEALS